MTAQGMPPSGKTQAINALPSTLHEAVLALPLASQATGESRMHCANASSCTLQLGGIPQCVAQSPWTEAEHMRASSLAQAMTQSVPPDVPPPEPLVPLDPLGVVETVQPAKIARIPKAIFLTEPPRSLLYRIE